MTRIAAILVAAALGSGAAAQTAPPATGTSARVVEPGVLTRLVKEEKAVREVVLVRRQGPTIFFRLTNSPPGVYSQFTADEFDEAEFRIQIPEQAAYADMVARRWLNAARRLHAAVAPALPFLDLKQNNAFEPTVRAAWCYVRAAQQANRLGGTGQVDAAKWLAEAHRLFAAAGAAAGWHPYGESAAIRAWMCLADIGRLDEAEAGLVRQREPEVGDAAWGVYWLARAQLLYAREQPRGALDAAIRSYLHETKDIETFPDALMLAAQCYEDLNEVHRARDVYYEVARLFPGTDWGDEARIRLKTMMEAGMTAAPEDPNITGIFFGTEENMNEKVLRYLRETETHPPTAPSAPGKATP
ncbi:MAG: hypothetical protein N2652_04915 [Kiritimatiellae bacterium]|nr:hypothetical protein [Kiritimatiellia bacterium]